MNLPSLSHRRLSKPSSTQIPWSRFAVAHSSQLRTQIICRFGLLAVCVLFLSLLFLQSAMAAPLQVDTSAADENLAKYFEVETANLASDCLTNINSLEDWERQKKVLRKQLHEMLGLAPLPPRTDLKVTYTGQVEEEEFVVKKLHFQSRPGLYVTGNLYLPRKVDKKLPAVLYVCGHGRVKKNGKSYGNKVHYHHHGSWFARNGYVCLTIDTLQLGEIEGIHHGTYREKMWWWLNRGYTPAGVEAWNCVRSLDFLQSLPEVDGERLGVTGRSGGGAYSWWIAALDERIKCAVPVAGITDLENHVVDGCVEGHCDCMFMVNTYRWDYPMLAALVAPRPLLISNTDNDGIFPLDGVYRTYQKVRKIYKLHGAANKVAFHITAGPHQDTQELRIHAFRWLNHHLKNDDQLISKPATKFFEPEQLNVFDQLPKDQKNTSIQETFVSKKEIDLPGTKSEWKSLYPMLKNQVLNKSFRGLPAKPGKLDMQIGEPRRIPIGSSGSMTHLTEVAFQSQKHVPLTLSILHRQPLKKVSEFLVMVVGPDDAKAIQSLQQSAYRKVPAEIVQRLPGTKTGKARSIESFLENSDQGLVFFTPRGVGKNQWNQDERKQTQIRRRFYLLGQTADTMRVYDIKRAVDVLTQLHPEHNPTICLQAKGTMAVNTVYASFVTPNISCLELLDPPATHRNGPYYLNVNRVLDVPQAIAIAAQNSKLAIQTDRADAFQFAIQASRLSQDVSAIKFIK